VALTDFFKLPGGGESVHPYISHIGMCRPKGYVLLHRFGLKTGIVFAHFGLESGMGFEEPTVMYKRIHCFSFK